MCLAVPGKVIKINDKTCLVDIMGVSTETSIDFLTDVNIGDYILIHAGSAIEKIDRKEALDTLKIFSELKEIMNG
ncbi:MAG: HypC/HybG/HupF family hydrogenase formation chaperone [Clostridia bacterium]